MLGFILTPDMGNAVPDGVLLAADNGCYSNPKRYSDDRYLAHLDRLPKDICLFATAPDAVADHAATVRRSAPMLRRIREAGHKAAFCAQDGWGEETTPWEEFDVLFVGGTTEFKFRGGRDAVRAAKRRGKKAHMGRVNSLDRLRAAKAIGCDSADGTFLKFAPDHNAGRLLRWLETMSNAPVMME